jgi:hypothetical protein
MARSGDSKATKKSKAHEPPTIQLGEAGNCLSSAARSCIAVSLVPD